MCFILKIVTVIFEMLHILLDKFCQNTEIVQLDAYNQVITHLRLRGLMLI